MFEDVLDAQKLELRDGSIIHEYTPDEQGDLEFWFEDEKPSVDDMNARELRFYYWWEAHKSSTSD